MLQIIPIRDLKNTSEISQKCHESNEPIYITKNGYGDMVIMSMEVYNQMMFTIDVFNKLDAAEIQIEESKILDGSAALDNIRRRLNGSR